MPYVPSLLDTPEDNLSVVFVVKMPKLKHVYTSRRSCHCNFNLQNIILDLDACFIRHNIYILV